MYSNLQIAHYYIVAVTALIAAGLAVLFTLKYSNIRKRKLAEQVSAKYEDWFTYLLANLDGDGKLHPPPEPPSAAESGVLLDRLIFWIDRLKGKQQAKLISLCEEMGFVDRQLARIESPFEWVRLDAAYRLGGMRAHRGVPAMLKLLEAVKPGPLSFIVARAIAKSAARPGELREMALKLLAGKPDSYELAADILQESELDYAPMLAEFLASEDEGKILLALAAMKQRTIEGSADRLYELTVFKRKEVRLQAAKLLTQPGSDVSPERLEALLFHRDGEVRAMAAEALGRVDASGTVAALRVALNDEEWHVRYHSAKSLARQGEAGLAALRLAAAEGEDGPAAEAARAVLREWFGGDPSAGEEAERGSESAKRFAASAAFFERKTELANEN